MKRDMAHHVGEGMAPECKERWSHFVLRKQRSANQLDKPQGHQSPASFSKPLTLDGFRSFPNNTASSGAKCQDTLVCRRQFTLRTRQGWITQGQSDQQTRLFLLDDRQPNEAHGQQQRMCETIFKSPWSLYVIPFQLLRCGTLRLYRQAFWYLSAKYSLHFKNFISKQRVDVSLSLMDGISIYRSILLQSLRQFECGLFPIVSCVWELCPQLVALFGGCYGTFRKLLENVQLKGHFENLQNHPTSGTPFLLLVCL